MMKRVEGASELQKAQVDRPKQQWLRRGPMMDRKVLAEEARKSEELREACELYAAEKAWRQARNPAPGPFKS